jgi:hypothetical protein
LTITVQHAGIGGVKPKPLIALYGSVNAVCALWTPPLTRSAIYQWLENDEVPELRQFQIREKNPEIDEQLAALPKKKEQRNGQRKAA